MFVMPLPDPPAAGAGLLERSTEIDAARRALSEAADGDGRLLVIVGPAGIGKTRLLDATRQLAEDRGVRVLTARGGRLERDFAYGVVRQLLERVVAGATPAAREALLAGPAAHAGRALGLDVGGEDEVRVADDQAFVVRHGLYWLLSNLALDGPVLVAVDDVQWADSPSLRLLAYLTRRLDGAALMVAVTARSDDETADDRVLAELTDEPVARRITPTPLSLHATVALLRGEDAEVDTSFAAACQTATGGNPFLLHELRTALHADDIAPIAANAHRVVGLGPSTVARSLILRIGSISPAAVAVARAVAVLGASTEPADAAELAGVDRSTALGALDGLVRAGVLATDRPLRFSHPILRDAVYHDLSLGDRERLHDAAARRLLQFGAPASAVAVHLLAISGRGSTESVQTLRTAAVTALGQGAADLATRYLQRALEEPPDAPDLAAVHGELGRAAWLAGEDPARAVAHLRTALTDTTDEQARPALAIALARAVFSTGDVTGAAPILEDELARPVDLPREDRLTLEAELGSIHLLHQGTPEHGRRILAFADLPGDTVAEMLALTNVAAWYWLQGTAEQVSTVGRRALGQGRAVAAAGSDSIAILQAAWTGCYADDFVTAQDTIAATLADARRTGSVFGLTCSSAMASIIAYRRGDIALAETSARDGMTVPGLPPFVHPTLHAVLAMALVERGELEEADQLMTDSWVGPFLPLLVQMTPAFWALGRLRMAQGRPDEARDAFLEGLDRDHQTFVHNPGVPWRTEAALALLALGERDEALRLVAEDEHDVRRWGTESSLGVWLHAAARTESDHEHAVGRFEEALEVLDRSPARLSHALTVVDLGVRLRRAGLPVRAREHLQEGLERARACGATALVRRAHEELLVAGARPRRLSFTGVDALTASERRICVLAAEGRSNRDIAQELFVTPKTVENHLGRAYTKLGISTREALAQALAADG